MGRPEIPSTIKERVLVEWLKGIPRAQIAEDNDISTGTVSNIINGFKRESIPNIHLLNKVAITLRKRGLNVNDFASVIRLRNILDRLELSEEDIESLLEEISEFCFIKEFDNKFFIEEMGKVISFTKKMHTPIDKLIPFLVDKSTELSFWQEKVDEKRKELENLYLEYDVTKEDFEQYKKDRPLRLQIEFLTKELDKAEEKNSMQSKIIEEYGLKVNSKTDN